MTEQRWWGISEIYKPMGSWHLPILPEHYQCYIHDSHTGVLHPISVNLTETITSDNGQITCNFSLAVGLFIWENTTPSQFSLYIKDLSNQVNTSKEEREEIGNDQCF